MVNEALLTLEEFMYIIGLSICFVITISYYYINKHLKEEVESWKMKYALEIASKNNHEVLMKQVDIAQLQMGEWEGDPINQIHGMNIMASGLVPEGEMVLINSDTINNVYKMDNPIIGVARSDRDENGKATFDLTSRFGIEVYESPEIIVAVDSGLKKSSIISYGYLKTLMKKSFVGSLKGD